MTGPVVDILMPTYNAGRWLDDSIGSITRQNLDSWRLIVRDDGSSDDTLRKLAAWAPRLGSRLVVLPDDGRGNVGQNVGTTLLMAQSSAPYIMLLDPDDVWLDGKMAFVLEAMRGEEGAAPGLPLAMCTDAKVVDGRLRPTHSSWWKSGFMAPRKRLRARDVAMESPALTSTMIFNRALAEIAAPIPAGTIGQDWWLALVAASFGKLVALPEATILYRVHGENFSEAAASTTFGQAAATALTGLGEMRNRVKAELVPTAARAAAFLQRYGQRLPPDEVAAIDALVGLLPQRGMAARAAIIRHGLWYSSRARNARLMALI